MKNFPFLRSIAGALIPCLLLLSIGCSSNKTLNALDTSDKAKTIIVCTTDSLFYRFPSYEWSFDDKGNLGGRAQEYRSQEDADEGSDAIGPTVTIPAERIASVYEPGGLTTTGGIIIGLLVLTGLVVLFFVGSMLEGAGEMGST